MRRAAALLLALFGVSGACGLYAAMSLGDGDPASDVLLGQGVYVPFNPTVSPGLQKQLTTQTAELAKGGLAVKVALIATPVDLGVVPDLFGHPQQYASFLDQEISVSGRAQPLLVVMPAGFGSAGLSPAGRSAVAALAKPGGSSSDDLARAAAAALPRIAAAQHVKLAGAAGAAGTPGSGNGRLVVILLGVAALLVAAALVVVTRGRRREAPEA